MSTKIRPELSEKNKYHIEKHRYYELKHFCLQYNIWKKIYCSLLPSHAASNISIGTGSKNHFSDPTCDSGVIRAYYKTKMQIVEDAAKETDIFLCEYILKAVTEELSYNYLRTRLDMPCSRDLYYDKYRKFFWILNIKRD